MFANVQANDPENTPITAPQAAYPLCTDENLDCLK